MRIALALAALTGISHAYAAEETAAPAKTRQLASMRPKSKFKMDSGFAAMTATQQQ